MLVLSRMRDESIIIGDNIVITVVDIRGDKVRLGIQASTEIPVHREEIFNLIQDDKLKDGKIEPNEYRHVIAGQFVIPKGMPLMPGTIIEVPLRTPTQSGGC